MNGSIEWHANETAMLVTEPMTYWQRETWCLNAAALLASISRTAQLFALKEFPSYNSIVWTGIGHGIMKVISCAEIFKRKHEGLHQVTKLRYVSSEKSKEDTATETHRIPEIHILLTKDIKDTTQLGYQAPGDCGKFPKKEDATGSKTNTTTESTDNMPCIDKQSSTMEKSGKRKNINKLKKKAEPPLKKNKVS